MHPRVVQGLLSPRTSAAWQGLWRLGRGFGKRRLRFFHAVDDPHSHQLLGLLPELAAAHDAAVEVRVVPPPTADQDPDAARARAFAVTDAVEWARFYEVPSPGSPPSPEAVRAAQVKLLESGRDLEAALAISGALWAGEVLEAEGDPAAGLAANQAELHRTGHYRGGTIFFEGEHYPGLSRVEMLERRLAGGDSDSVLRPRASPAPEIERVAPGTKLEWFYSFRSPYSYLSVAPMRALLEAYDVELVVRPVLPMVMRGLAVPFRKRLFLARDAKRIAEARGQPFGRLADPIGVGVERLLAVWPLARERGRALDFLDVVGRSVWADGIDVAADPGLHAVSAAVDISPEEVRAALEDETWRDEVERNRAALLELGLWGVPSFSIPGYQTWGQDRMFMLEARLPIRR